MKRSIAHRVKLISISVLSVLLLSYVAYAIAWNMSQPEAAAITQQPPKINVNTYDIYTLVNKQRTLNNLQPLSLNPQLEKSATEKCQDMVTNKYFEHVSPSGTSPWDFIKAQTYYMQAGENLAIRYNTPNEIVWAWMESPTHKENIVKAAYTDVGYATCTNSSSELMVVQHFIEK